MDAQNPSRRVAFLPTSLQKKKLESYLMKIAMHSRDVFLRRKRTDSNRKTRTGHLSSCFHRNRATETYLKANSNLASNKKLVIEIWIQEPTNKYKQINKISIDK